PSGPRSWPVVPAMSRHRIITNAVAELRTQAQAANARGRDRDRGNAGGSDREGGGCAPGGNWGPVPAHAAGADEAGRLGPCTAGGSDTNSRAAELPAGVRP